MNGMLSSIAVPNVDVSVFPTFVLGVGVPSIYSPARTKLDWCFRVLSKNTNELKTGAPGRFDRHRPMASPRSGACRRRCRRFGFPARAGKTPSSNGMPRSRAETWIQAAPGPERASRLRRGSPGLDSGPLGRPLFRRCTALSATRSPPLAQTWHSKIEIRDQNRK